MKFLVYMPSDLTAASCTQEAYVICQ